MEPTKTTPYFQTQQFLEDCERLADSSPKGVDPARWAICLRWSENIIAMGGFPNAEQNELLATFAFGEISVAKLIEELRVDDAVITASKITLP
ncbi:hypothetical protein [Massilia sp. S19_KUP03_FR1]|uniref:hypothetical protein n=1 Tax=Massilia sp. S19_KUP03_FR1 TaxID=3025503 RepID=UPI002FCD2B46